MPENSTQNQVYYPQSKVVSISKNAPSREQPKYNKPHCIIPEDDINWALSQAQSIRTLWKECWISDRYGSRFVKLTTSLKDTAFRVARRVLYAAGLFEFKRDTCTEDTRKTAGWLIINLHGARRIKEFWNSDPISVTDTPIDGESAPISVTDAPISRANLTISRANLLPISSETLINTGVSEPLSNSSGSSQELLKEVPEEEELTPPKELVEQVPSVNQTEVGRNVLQQYSRDPKIEEKLASIRERCMKKALGEQPERCFRELFITRYKWKIDDERFQQLVQLTKECTLSFFGKFKYVYQNDGMSAPRTFDKAIELVIKNASSINEAVKLQLEAFTYQPTS
ncbi:MAG: hypothetical protein ACYTXY_07580 [Nostoc sp.]